MSDENPSRLIADDFDKLAVVGKGAAGEVWKAKPRKVLPFATPDDLVALKLYLTDILNEPGQRQRIIEEYRTGSRLVHPNLVRIHHVDVECDPPFLVMEWCEGSDLAAWRSGSSDLDDDFLLQFTTQMLDVLEFLHSSRRFHRDIKPKNIHIDAKGKIRLLDYGIIRSLREPGITQSDARFVGTYRYAAPEYIFDNKYSYSADLYSLGAVLYFLLHGTEVFAVAKRSVDVINAKKEHNLHFDAKLQTKGPIWKEVFDLCKQLLSPNVADRPASAMACLDFLGKHLHPMLPLRVYFACSLTRSDAGRREHIEQIAKVVRHEAQENGFSLYIPGEHTHPLGSPNLSAAEVYWIDRERVASSDLLFVLADDPSFGVGQEVEIAANSGVPIVIFHSTGVDVSRMLRGMPGRILGQLDFADISDLRNKVGRFFLENKSRLGLSRRTREREYHLRVGNRVREIREDAVMSVPDLASKIELSAEWLDSLESRPEQLTNISLVILRRIARALGVSPAELLRDQSSKDQLLEDLTRASVGTLRQFAKDKQLSYEIYSQLKVMGREAVRDELEAKALRSSGVAGLKLDDWRRLYGELLDGNNPLKPG